MYHYIQDKDFRKRLKSTCSDIVNQLVQSINKGSVLKTIGGKGIFHKTKSFMG